MYPHNDDAAITCEQAKLANAFLRASAERGYVAIIDLALTLRKKGIIHGGKKAVESRARRFFAKLASRGYVEQWKPEVAKLSLLYKPTDIGRNKLRKEIDDLVSNLR